MTKKISEKKSNFFSEKIVFFEIVFSNFFLLVFKLILFSNTISKMIIYGSYQLALPVFGWDPIYRYSDIFLFICVIILYKFIAIIHVAGIKTDEASQLALILLIGRVPPPANMN